MPAPMLGAKSSIHDVTDSLVIDHSVLNVSEVSFISDLFM